MAQRLPLPIGLGEPPGCTQEWWNKVWLAWQASLAGVVPEAGRLYDVADADLNDCTLNASLSILRHNVGKGSGTVVPVTPTEDRVVSFFLSPYSQPDENNHRHELGPIAEDHIRQFIENIEPGHHRENIRAEREHVMVLSTGRCGTMSLYKLFDESNLTPYHTYWFMVHPCTRLEMMARLFAGNLDSLHAPAEWASTRAAEWLGDKPMIGLNHSDTIFAPVFAAIHPKAKFIYLRREPEDVFKSFYTKKQWNGGANHFHPLSYDFDGGYRFSIPEGSVIDGIKWHIDYTEIFSRTFGKVVEDRFIEISADSLFAQDEREIRKLLDFTGSDVTLEKAKEHFSHKINEKKDRLEVPTEQLVEPLTG